MNSKSHLYISLIKSVIRMIGCGWAMLFSQTLPIYILGGALIVAETLGILEEIFDENTRIR